MKKKLIEYIYMKMDKPSGDKTTHEGRVAIAEEAGKNAAALAERPEMKEAKARAAYKASPEGQEEARQKKVLDANEVLDHLAAVRKKIQQQGLNRKNGTGESLDRAA